MNAEQLQAKYGDVLLEPPLISCGAARLLWIQFKEVYPSISIGEQPFKTWIEKHRLPPGTVRVSIAAELDEHNGEKNPTSGSRVSYRLHIQQGTEGNEYLCHPGCCQALKRWLDTYGG